MNYEVVEGSFVFCDDFVSHARQEKENIAVNKTGIISPHILSKALKDVFDGSKIKKARRGTGKNKRQVFLNLRRKSSDNDHADNTDVAQDWLQLCTNITTIAQEVSEWKVMTNNGFSLSCLRLENTRYNNQRAVIEIVFSLNEGRIVTEITYHQRAIHHEYMEEIEKHLHKSRMDEKARALMTFLEKSSVCTGFQVDEAGQFEINNVQKYIVCEENGQPEERVFSNDCRVLTNSGGKCCCNCSELKHYYNKEKKRHLERADLEPSSKTNHRWMSREQLIQKLEAEKKRRLAEKKLREQVVAQMVEVEESDHYDLKKMMESVETNDVPQDMSIFWDQQQKMLETTSKKGYRWHPRYDILLHSVL